MGQGFSGPSWNIYTFHLPIFFFPSRPQSRPHPRKFQLCLRLTLRGLDRWKTPTTIETHPDRSSMDVHRTPTERHQLLLYLSRRHLARRPNHEAASWHDFHVQSTRFCPAIDYEGANTGRGDRVEQSFWLLTGIKLDGNFSFDITWFNMNYVVKTEFRPI